MSQIWVHCWVMASLKICFKGKRRDSTFQAKLSWNETYVYIRSDWTAAKMCASRKATGNVIISKRALYKPKKKWDGQLPQLQTSKKISSKKVVIILPDWKLEHGTTCTIYWSSTQTESECRCNHRHTCSSLRVTKIATLLGFAQWVWHFHQIPP